MAGIEEADDLTCPVCLSSCQNPALLSCSHIFCRECITEVLDYQRAQGRVYTCPVCQQQYQDFPALQASSPVQKCHTMQASQDHTIPCSYCLDHPNMAVKTCLNCEVSLCQQHLERHKNKSHTLLEPTDNLQERKCLEHDRLLEYYCEEDDCCVCVTCYIAGGHHGHRIRTLKEAHEKQLTALSATTSSLSANLEALNKDIEDLNTGLAKVKENTVRLSRPLEDLCDRITMLVKKEFEEIAQAVTANQEKATSEITALLKNMEDAKAATEQAMEELNAVSKQTDDLLFLKDYIRSQTLLKQGNPKVDSLQVVDVEADQKMIASIDEETTDFIASLGNSLKYMHTVLSQQTQQMVWSGTQRQKVEQSKPDFQFRCKKSEKIDLNFSNTCYNHCSYVVTVSNLNKTLQSKRKVQDPSVNSGLFGSSSQPTLGGFGTPFTSAQSGSFGCGSFGFGSQSAFGTPNMSGQSGSFGFGSQSAFGTPNKAPLSGGLSGDAVGSRKPCNCNLPIVLPISIDKCTFTSKYHCLVDVSLSNDWCVGLTNRGSNNRYLQYRGNQLSYEGNKTSLSIGNQKINTLKMQLDFDANVLGFYDVSSEMPLIICRCDYVFARSLNIGFNITDGSLTLI